jgi:hypothetical protein
MSETRVNPLASTCAGNSQFRVRETNAAYIWSPNSPRRYGKVLRSIYVSKQFNRASTPAPVRAKTHNSFVAVRGVLEDTGVWLISCSKTAKLWCLGIRLSLDQSYPTKPMSSTLQALPPGGELISSYEFSYKPREH